MNQHTIQHAIGTSFIKYTNSVAIDSTSGSVTYRALEGITDVIVLRLLQVGVTKGSLVACYMKNTTNLIPSILAILKIGAIFVPFDSNAPSGNTRDLMRSVRLDALIHDETLLFETADTINLIDLRNTQQTKNEKTDISQFPVYTPDENDPTYLFFTSGTTGTPNAVLGKNKSLTHFIQWEIETLKLDAPRVSQLISPGFDAILRDIFVPLLSGGTICLLPERSTLHDPFALKKWLNAHKVNLIHCVPSILAMLLDVGLEASDLMSVRYILMSGERVKPGFLKNWFACFGTRIQLVNLYGATETTMIRTYHMIRPGDANLERIPIGKPISGTRTLVLDEDMNVCEKEVVGELYIRTPYATFGYYNNAELTATKFIQNPFNTDPTDRIYKTGDLCKLCTDGNLDFIGRTDRLVKVRGVRVELDDLENKIARHPEVKEVVVHKFDDGQELLAAFIIPQANSVKVDEKVRIFLAEQLPEYLIPNDFVLVAEMPRKMNGKIAFDQLKSLLKKKNKVDAKTKEEKEIFAIWSDILKHEEFDIATSFFSVGGHSLNALLLINRLQKKFSVKIPVNKVFELDTIKAQVQYFASHNQREHSAIGKAPASNYYTVSSAQYGLFISQQINPASTAYNTYYAVNIKGDFNIDLFKAGVQTLINAHEILRTSFHLQGKEVVQKIHEQGVLRLTMLSDRDLPTTLEQVNEHIKPFALDEPSQIEFIIIKYGIKQHVLVVNGHHIINDGYSQMLIFKALVDFYNGQVIASPTIQHRDYSEWQRSSHFRTALQRQEDFWKKSLAGELPLLELPTDYERTTDFSVEGNTFHFELPDELCEKIKRLSAEYSCTPNVILYSIYTVFLSKISNQQEVIVGVPVLGRTHADLENSVGMFVNMVVLRSQIQENQTFQDLLEAHKKMYRSALENQNYSFDELLKWARFKRTEGRSPLVNTTFLYKDFYMDDIKLNGLEIQQIATEKPATKFDLTLTVDKGKEKYYLSFVYSTKLFKPETINHFVCELLEIGNVVMDNATIPLYDTFVRPEKNEDALHYVLTDNLEDEVN